MSFLSAPSRRAQEPVNNATAVNDPTMIAPLLLISHACMSWLTRDDGTRRKPQRILDR